MIHVGVDLHRAFCYMTAVDTSGRVLQRGRVENQSECLRNYFASFREAPEVAFEACSFWPAFVDAVEGMVGRLVMVHPQRVKAISSAKLKNDRVDSETLAHLLRTNLLPESWIANREVRELRQQARLRVELGRDRAHVKQRIHAVLHQQGQRFPGSDLFGKAGRVWLDGCRLSPAGRNTVTTYLRVLDALEEQVREQQQRLTQLGKEDERVRWLATIPGIGVYSAVLLLSEIGDVHRFSDKHELFSYAGLVPRVRESADRKQRSGISRCGSDRLRWILVEAAHTAQRTCPAARAYVERLSQKKHANVARVALARKLLAAAYALLRDGVCFDEAVFAV